jgi:hypothetical protein
VCVGSLDSPGVVLRCASYGNAKMTVEQMQMGYERDDAVFRFTALLNDSLFYDPRTRAKLEQYVQVGPDSYYHRRCLQIKDRSHHFDVTPVGEDAILEDEQAQPAESRSIQRLEKEVAGLAKQLRTLSTMVQWGLVALIILLVFAWRRHI